MIKKNDLIFASIVYPAARFSEMEAVLLTESIRAFAGSLSRSPIWFFIPEFGRQLSDSTRDKLLAMDVKLVPFKFELEVLRFPFTADVTAAALAESMALSNANVLAWLTANTVVLNEPVDFLLPEKKVLGYRPVHHTLIGSRYGEPLDSFWTIIYKRCAVPEERVFPMKPHVEDEKLRPYFNAGMLVVRPEKRLFQSWHETFFSVYQDPSLKPFYQQDERYAVFIHQAVLVGVTLSLLKTDEMLELPPTYNYPIHLYSEDKTDSRPASIEKLATFRHEGFGKSSDWVTRLPAGPALKKWFAERIVQEEG